MKGTARIRFTLGRVFPGLVGACLFSLVGCALHDQNHAKALPLHAQSEVVSKVLDGAGAELMPWQVSMTIPEDVILFLDGEGRRDSGIADLADLGAGAAFAHLESYTGENALTDYRAVDAAVDDNVFEVMDDRLSRPRTSQARWYIFAGSGGDTLTFEPGGTSFGDGWRVENKTIVGDGQAGLGMRLGPANLALGYVRRELSAHSRLNDLRGNEVESYAAFSLSFGH